MLNQTALVIFLTWTVSACQSAEFHVRRAKTLCRLPAYDYGFDARRVSTVGESGVGVPVTISLPVGKSGVEETVRTDRSIPIKEGSRSVTVTTRTKFSRQKRLTVAGKRFLIAPLAAGPARLSRISALVDESGRMELSGILNHTGGPLRSLKGGRIEVQVRLHSSVEPESDTTVNATEFSLTHVNTSARYWVTRGERKAVAIRLKSTRIARSFSLISRVEVQLVYRRDR